MATEPLTLGTKTYVRLRPKTLKMPPFSMRMWILTGPHGRSALDGRTFAMESQARLYANDKGWTILG